MSIKSRLILMLLVISLMSMLVIGYLGWSNGRQALHAAIFNQLTAVRASKAYQIETYFQRIFNQTLTLAEDQMVVDAMKEFRAAFLDVSTWPLEREWEAGVDTFYRETFLPRLAANVDGTPLVEVYRPRTTAATYLQYHYIAANPYPPDDKRGLTVAETDPSTYRLIHARLHAIFSNMVTRFGYDDLFLIDIRTGDVVYSVYKRAEFGTSLREGPYRESNFGQLFRTVQEAPEQGAVRIADFRPYRPSYAAPAAFVAAPIYDGAEAIGVLALRLPVDEINQVMTGGRNWRADGLGETGETYLVGPDLRMRSVSRFLVENPATYQVMLQTTNVAPATSARIRQFNTTILLQPVNTTAVQKALRGQEGTETVLDYRNVPVLSSYAPLRIQGLEWVILSEMDATEAFAPVDALERSMLIWSAVLVVLITLAALVLSYIFVRPIDKLIAGVREVGAGRYDVAINLTTEDEFGDLAGAFNGMVASVRGQRELIEAQRTEIERLLLSILPAPIAERLRAGERVADRMEQVSVLFIRVFGFTRLAQQQGADESAVALDRIINMLDDQAERFEVEPVKTIANTYVAACGLTSARLDHAKRALDFAAAAIKLIQTYDVEKGVALAMQIGINSGPVVAGVVGSRRFRYELWGETVNVAHRIHLAAEPNTVLVTEQVYERVHPFYAFERHAAVPYRDEEQVAVWRLVMGEAHGAASDGHAEERVESAEGE